MGLLSTIYQVCPSSFLRGLGPSFLPCVSPRRPTPPSHLRGGHVPAREASATDRAPAEGLAARVYCSHQHKPCLLFRKFTLGPRSGCHLVPGYRSEPSRCTTSCLPAPFPVTLPLALTLFLG